MSHEVVDAPLIVASILESNLEDTLVSLRGVRIECGLVEIRADRLDAVSVRQAVRAAARPIIVTVRGPLPQGRFDGTIDERRLRLDAALEAGAEFIDVEYDGPFRELARGPHARRVILSHHGAPCEDAALGALWREMADSPAARLKIVPHAQRPAELRAVHDLLVKTRHDRRLCCFASGRAGALSRLLAPAWGSWATYGAARPGRPTAPGQFTVDDLVDVYRVLRIGNRTRRSALLGSSVFGSPSPAMHAVAGADSVLFPVEIDELAEADPILGAGPEFRISALAVTRPFKEEVARRCASLDPMAERAGAVNTVRCTSRGWEGSNTDAPAAIELLARDLVLAGSRVAILGGGGTARAIGSALIVRGAQVTLFVRQVRSAAAAAAAIGATVRPWAERRSAEWDLLVQATPLGTRGEDALEGAPLTGRALLDVVYAAGGTPLTRRAKIAGLIVIDGIDLLVEQGRRQIEILIDASPDRFAMRAAADAWLAARTQQGTPETP